MNSLSYIHDGYTQEGYIADVPRLHGALRFAYRPSLVEERSQLADLAARVRSQAYDRYLATFIADKLVSWDLQDCNGADVPIAAESILRLQPELFGKLHGVVLGRQASDLDPCWPTDAESRLFEAETEAALTGRTIGEVREEQDEKN
jgi:hypothetical protein